VPPWVARVAVHTDGFAPAPVRAGDADVLLASSTPPISMMSQPATISGLSPTTSSVAPPWTFMPSTEITRTGAPSTVITVV